MITLAEWLPHARDEEFKYTSFAALARREFTRPQPVQVDRAALPAAFGTRLCFLDGCYVPELSDESGLPAGLRVEPAARSQFTANTAHDRNVLYQMNAAMTAEGTLVTLEENVELQEPVELLFLSSEHPGEFAAQPWLRVQAGKKSGAAFVERHIALGESRDFINLTIDLHADVESSLTWMQLQQAAPQATLATGLYATLEQEASLASHAVQLGGRLVRADIEVRLAGAGAHCGLYGLHLGGGRQHHDTHTRLDHLVADTSSDEHYRLIADQGARGVFNGKVVVHAGADRTDAQQYNANLLLSEQAEIDTKPELQIHADDVKCSHGATVGQLDEDALFYLRSRGIGEETARSILVWAFAETVLGKLPVQALRELVEESVLARLPDAGRIREFR